WHYNVDGTDTIVTESSTKDPLHPVKDSTFEPAAAFPKPLAFTWSDTRGADLSWVPIEFQKSLRLAYSRTHYGKGYYIFHRFVPGAKLSHPLQSWNPSAPVDAGEDIGFGIALPAYLGSGSTGAVVDIPAGAAVLVKRIEGPNVIREIRIMAPRGR